MRFIRLFLFVVLPLSGCTTLYPEYSDLIQDEITAKRELLARELAQRDPPARLMFGMMVAKARCDIFWQELEQQRTGGAIALANLQYATKTLPAVLQIGAINEKAVANIIYAVGTIAEFQKNNNELALLGIEKYRTALREKWDQKQRYYFDENLKFARDLEARPSPSGWSRLDSDEVNMRLYDYARLCTRPELLMTFDQVVTQARLAPDPNSPGKEQAPTTTRSIRRAPSDAPSRTLPGFRVVN